MSEPEKIIEHHYSAPSQGQVTKAMYQYLADQGVTVNKLMEIVAAKISEAIQAQIAKEMQSNRWEKLIVGAVAEFLRSEKASYDRAGGYGVHNRIKDLVEGEIKRLVLDDYQISITRKGK